MQSEEIAEKCTAQQENCESMLLHKYIILK